MLNGEIALVTGASRGIGRAIAETLLAQGAAVAGTATTEGGAVRIRDELAGPGRRVLGLRLDVTDPASVTSVLAQVSDGLGAMPGILVNNAGITRDGLLLRMQDADWDAVIDTNLTSVYRITKACLRPMTKARQGRIINIASVVAASGNAGQANYAAAKAGMIGFTKSLAREVGARGVTANCVAPGFIDTDMTRALGEQQRQHLLASIPLARLGAAQEVAAAVAFLASPAAGYITGETLHVNGGMYMA
ncbi:3-oxoacyl-ACP reductase FabG [uncultured Thiohalocapsa sp.]|uniref:3-oxoacyl-ACP reductase FabG n=1 Tax=uncultured Thiohalocapsa sp. TaxID=768990 RepID=UPI0025D7281D|nr:3-oxoacyl-ACP reductase FabG [uncultured Thiohalocapsa sp.]